MSEDKKSNFSLSKITEFEKNRYDSENWEGSFQEYLEIVENNPKVTRTAFQRLYDMILYHDKEEYTEFKEKVIRYKFFDDPFDKGEDAVYGIDKYLDDFVELIAAAADGYGIKDRILLLHGPVGTAKSTIARLIKKGLEHYTKLPEGCVYTLGWVNLNEDEEDVVCPMHEEPVHLIPQDYRKNLNVDNVVGNLCPLCNYYFEYFMDLYEGDFEKVLNHIKVKRFTFSESKRVGIATFQPKDEKNQDSTELTGDINYRLIAKYGKDSDPRAFNFDGEFNVANRGMIEMIEVLKLDVAFLYDLLTASQEHKIKPKKFSHVDIDEILLSHSVHPDTVVRIKQNNNIKDIKISKLSELDCNNIKVLSYDFDNECVIWEDIVEVHSHNYFGEWYSMMQEGFKIVTTDSHGVYNSKNKLFLPNDFSNNNLKIIKLDTN